jgi:hypothetical protein
MKALLIASTVCATLACAHPAFANLLVDPGFETPVVTPGTFSLFNSGTTITGTPWSVVGVPGNVGIVSGTFQQNGFSFVAQEGVQWLDLTGLNTNAAIGVQQTVATIPGTTYALSFFVGNVVNPGGIFGTTSTVNVLLNGAPLLSATNSLGAGSTSQTWQQFTSSFMATGSSVTLAFINGDSATDNDNGLDGINLVVSGQRSAVPEPDAWSLMLLGFAGLGAIVRRRRDPAPQIP